MFKLRPNTATDSYKLGHMRQYPEGTELVYANFTPRSMKYFNAPKDFPTNHIVWYGVQSVLMEMIDFWEREFFSKDINEIENYTLRRVGPFVGPSGFDFNKMRQLHEYGRLPIEVRSLPEGTRVPAGVPPFIIFNTQPKFYWVTNFLETPLSVELWKMSTAATTADLYYRIFQYYAEETGAPLEFVPWQAHDFSMRGLSNLMDAAKIGSAHLTSMMGTDSLPALDFLDYYYSGQDCFLGGSVPATEHSVMTMGGPDDELSLFKRLITEVYPNGIVSVVSDSWDYWKVLTEYAPALKEAILARGPDALGNAKVVFRPDSGDPIRIICGYEPSMEFVPAGLEEAPIKGSIATLWDTFPGTVNAADFKVVDSHVGLIYGDSITPQRADVILHRLKHKGFASNNLVLGIGSYTYQYATRDTCGWAMKATYGIVNGEGREIFKDPKTDDGTKKSARGLLKVIRGDDGELQLLDRQEDINDSGLLEPIMRDGKMVKLTTISEIRELIASTRVGRAHDTTNG